MMSSAKGGRFHMISRPMVFMRGLLSRARRIVVPDRRVCRKDNSSSSAGAGFRYTEGHSPPGEGSARLVIPGLPVRAESGGAPLREALRSRSGVKTRFPPSFHRSEEPREADEEGKERRVRGGRGSGRRICRGGGRKSTPRTRRGSHTP